jgi:hypothetical protein
MPATFDDYSPKPSPTASTRCLNAAGRPTVLDTHTHPFALKARVVRGEMWLTVGDDTRHLQAGDDFNWNAAAEHAERYGHDRRRPTGWRAATRQRSNRRWPTADRHIHQRPARLYRKIAGQFRRRPGLKAQATGQRDHRAVVGAEFQFRVIDAEALAFCLFVERRPQLFVGADAAGHTSCFRPVCFSAFSDFLTSTSTMAS